MSEARFARVTALLTSAPGRPAGDTRCGVEIELCLTPLGEPDRLGCATDAAWSARRFWRDRPDWNGFLIPLDGDRWGLRGANDPDEPFWELRGRRFRPGDHLTLRRPNGEELTFRVVSVETVRPTPRLSADAGVHDRGPVTMTRR